MVQVVFEKEPSALVATDLLVVGVFSKEWAESSLCQQIDAALGGVLFQAAKEQDFSGKAKQQLVLHTMGQLSAKRVALIGLGARAELQPAGVLAYAGSARRLGDKTSARSVALCVPEGVSDAVPLMSRAVMLAGYAYHVYKSDKGRERTVERVVLMGAEAKTHASAMLDQQQALVHGVHVARDLVNESPSVLYPQSFAEKVQTWAQEAGLGCQVFDQNALQNMGMRLLLAVGAGSAHAPYLVHLTCEGTDRNAAPVALVGKGITFDSGGLCLKPPAGMMDMKVDMSGAAAVVGAMLALAKVKPKRTVHAVLALAENMPSGTSYRLGDVITSAAGKTVEINNTDAEGRLVLADALHYVLGLKPEKIIDLATLTGACMVALGPSTTGLFSNNDAFAKQVLESSHRVGEDMWRMPLNAALKEQLKSEVADMRNTGDRNGGAITAALFLKEFVGDTPWVHLDIAGPATSSENAGIYTKGGTGVGVATLTEWLWHQI